MAHTARSTTVTPLTTYRSSLRRHAPNGLVNRIKEIAAHQANKVEGCFVVNPTTGSVQTNNAGGGAVDWNVNIEPGIITVGGVALHREKAADFDVSNAVKLAEVGESVAATIYAKNHLGTVTVEKILGAAAVTGAQIPPTDEAITAACAAGDSWIRVADIVYNRTGDAALTQAQDSTQRPNHTVNVGTGLDITV